jgi:hypothetical protein
MVREAIVMRRSVRRHLEQLTPRGPSEALRERVLRAVERELAGSGRSRWERRCACAVAASLLIALTAYYSAVELEEVRYARLFGPTTTPQAALELRKALEAETDSDTAEWMMHHYALDRRPRRALQGQMSLVTGLHSLAEYAHEH